MNLSDEFWLAPRCEHCDKRIISPWSRLVGKGLWHNRCMKRICGF